MKIYNETSGSMILDLIKKIRENKDYLSEIDGKIGDGDHGINMSKGFTLCRSKLEGRNYSLSEGLSVLSSTLMEDIGGSMGPLYGVLFGEMAEVSGQEEVIDSDVFEKMLTAALDGVLEIGSAKKGDKTLLDVLIPAAESYQNALKEEKNFSEALEAMKEAAEEGWLSTKEMTAKIGRASRLGERSKGVLDAGATSCNMILQTLASSMEKILKA